MDEMAVILSELDDISVSVGSYVVKQWFWYIVIDDECVYDN